MANHICLSRTLVGTCSGRNGSSSRRAPRPKCRVLGSGPPKSAAASSRPSPHRPPLNDRPPPAGGLRGSAGPEAAEDCRLQTADCRLQTADCRLQTRTVRAHVHADVHVCTCAHAYAHVCMCMRMRIVTYMYTYTYRYACAYAYAYMHRSSDMANVGQREQR